MKSDSEKQIIGAWLQNEHLEDMKLFKAEDFPEFSNLVAMMMDGERDHFKLVRGCGISPAIPGILTRESNLDLYSSYVADAIEDLGHRYLEENIDKPLSEIEEGLKRYTNRASDLPKANRDAVVDLIEDIADRANRPMVRTGIPTLDIMMNGVRKKELTFVGARPSVGKSAFIQQIAVKVAQQEKKVLFFPLEMSEMAIMQRMLLTMVNISQYDLKRGKRELIEREDFKRATSAMDNFIRKGNFLVYERCNDIEKIRGLIKEHQPYMVVVDQLEQLKDGSKSWQDKRSRFSYMTHELQAISLDMDVAVWVACQANRGAEDTPPTLANLKESGTIEEDATNVILLHRSSEKTEEQTIQLELAKQKDGECGAFDMIFKASKFTFGELTNRY